MNAQVNFVDHLKRQLKFLERSCESYDNGNIDEGIRIATVIRVLVHNTNSSTSLLKHLNATTINFSSSASDPSPQTSFYMGMGVIRYENGKITYIPNLGSLPLVAQIPVSKWWAQVVMVVDKGRRISRRQIVLGAVNNDGGAHVDSKLNKEYEALTLDGVLGVIYHSSGGIESSEPTSDVHLLSLRQMAYELLNSPELLKLANYVPSYVGKQMPSAVQTEPASATILKLRADAIAAYEAKQLDNSYALWCALIELDPTDARAHYNAGITANEMGNNILNSESVLWFKQAEQHLSHAFSIKQDLNDVAYDWGNALASQANLINENDIISACKLWQQAGEKFQLALNINDGKHEAANNWGRALDEEAQAVFASNPVAARRLWQLAGEKFQLALNIKPDKHEAVNNWGSALIAEARAISTIDLPAARRLWQQAIEKFQQALIINPKKYQAFRNWGVALALEAKAIASSDLFAARKYWHQAGEKFQQALNIKSDIPEIANLWGIALIDEAAAMSYADTLQANLLLDHAEKLLIKHTESASGLVAYSLACIYGRRGDVASCLHWLKIRQANNSLPACNRLQNDPNLDAVRTSPEFVDWLQKVCP